MVIGVTPPSILIVPLNAPVTYTSPLGETATEVPPLTSVSISPPIYFRSVGLSLLVYLAMKALLILVVVIEYPPPILKLPLNSPVTYTSPLGETATEVPPLTSVSISPPIYFRSVGLSLLVYLATKALISVLLVLIGVTPPPISNVPINLPITYTSPLDETATEYPPLSSVS